MRFSTVIQNAILSDEPQRIRYFLKLQWPSGWLYVHSGMGERVYKGNTYLGVGELGTIGQVSEDGKGNAKRLSISLSITDPTLVRDVLADDPIGNGAELDIVVLDENLNIIDGDLLFSGTIGDLDVVKSRIAKVTISLVDWLEIWNRPIENNMYSDAAQQALYPGDKFFDQVELLASKPLNSGVAGAPVASTSGGSGSGGKSASRLRLR
jgi:hypothetical protein